MTHTLHNLAKRMNARAVEAREGMERKIRVAASVTVREAVEGTPVDRGHARASWEVGINTVPAGDREPFAPYSALFSKVATYRAGRHNETANLIGAVADAEAVLKSYRLGDRIIVRNAVTDDETGQHYLAFLNQIPGYSLQPAALAGLFFLENANEAGREAGRSVKVLR
jgi:hypothetical protein